MLYSHGICSYDIYIYIKLGNNNSISNCLGFSGCPFPLQYGCAHDLFRSNVFS